MFVRIIKKIIKNEFAEKYDEHLNFIILCKKNMLKFFFLDIRKKNNFLESFRQLLGNRKINFRLVMEI